MKLLASFDPPNAGERAQRFRDTLCPVMADMPPEAIRIDIVRTVNGDAVRIWLVEEQFADRIPEALRPE
jgi:hypothetical protein